MDLSRFGIAFLFSLAGCSAAGPTGGSVPEPVEDLGLAFTAGGSDPEAKIQWQRDQQHASSSGPLIDHGGRVLPVSSIYAIWWGNQGAFPSDAKSGIGALFGGLAGTAFLGITKQYMRGGSSTTSFVTDWADTSAPPSHAPQTSTIGSEVCRQIVANGAQPDPNAVYFVFTSNFPNAKYCAWHGYSTCNGATIQIAYMPNSTGVAGCDPGNLYSCNSYSQGTRSLANGTSHEFMEAVTDPDLSAWYDSSGSEIGDKCAWRFSSCVNLTGHSWQLQEEWSNAAGAAGACVQQ
jgi:hypothetical protein